MSEIIKDDGYEVKEAGGWENEGGASEPQSPGEVSDIQPEGDDGTAPLEGELILSKPNELTLEAKFNGEPLFTARAPGLAKDTSMFVKVLVENEAAAESIAALMLNAATQQLAALAAQQRAVSKGIVTATDLPNRQQRRAFERLTRKA